MSRHHDNSDFLENVKSSFENDFKTKRRSGRPDWQQEIEQTELPVLPFAEEDVAEAEFEDIDQDVMPPVPALPPVSERQQPLAALQPENDLPQTEQFQASDEAFGSPGYGAESGDDQATAPTPTFHADALQARLSQPDVFPLGLHNEEVIDDDSVIASLLQSMQPQQGEIVVVSADLRREPDFRKTAVEAIQALERREGIPQNNKPGGIMIATFRVVFKIVAVLLRLIMSFFVERDRSSSQSHTQPLTREEREELKPTLVKLKRKKDASRFFDVRLNLFAISEGNPVSVDLHHIESVLDSKLSEHGGQSLIWSKADAVDCALGVETRSTPKMVLSDAELSRFMSPPDDDVLDRNLNLERAVVPLHPGIMPPVIKPGDRYTPRKGILPVGYLNHGGADETVVGLDNAAADTHVYITGGTGTGKSTLAMNLINGIVRADYPLIVLDPHGALTEDAIQNVAVFAPHRVDDVVVLDLADTQFPIAINPLDVRSEQDIPEARQALKTLLERKQFSSGNQYRAVQYVELMAQAMCEVNLQLPPENKLSLHHATGFFNDAELRHLIVEFSHDRKVKETFDPDNGTFERLSENDQREHSQAILRAFNSLLEDDSFAQVFATTNRLDLAELIRANKIILLKLAAFGGASSTELGEIVATMVLPSLLTAIVRAQEEQLQMGRTLGLDLKGARLVIDEAPAVIQGERIIKAITTILAQARKWDMGLMLLSQSPSQFESPILRTEIFTNVQAKFAFKTDQGTTAGFEKSLSGGGREITAQELNNLPAYHAFCNYPTYRQNQKAYTGAFLCKTLEPPVIAPGSNADNAVKAAEQQIVHNSRELLAVPKQHAEARVEAAFGGEDVKDPMLALLREQATEEEIPAPIISDDNQQGNENWTDLKKGVTQPDVEPKENGATSSLFGDMS